MGSLITKWMSCFLKENINTRLRELRFVKKRGNCLLVSYKNTYPSVLKMKNHTDALTCLTTVWDKYAKLCYNRHSEVLVLFLWYSFLNNSCKSAEPVAFSFSDRHRQQTESSGYLSTWRALSIAVRLANIYLSHLLWHLTFPLVGFLMSARTFALSGYFSFF